ncbi:MAG: hypothetical protein ACUVX9_17670, partial [Anaerolineae bacterium]
WREAAGAVRAAGEALAPPSAAPLRGALQRIDRRRAPWRRAWSLLLAQVPLVRHGVWPASALVMGLGVVVSLLMGAEQGRAWVVQALAPLVAAAGVAVLYGPGEDPCLELALATPTSPRQVLLARLALVYGYNLLLALAASAALLSVVPLGLMGGVILGWLAPMTFLSALALLFSLVLGAGNAITIAYGLWLARGVVGNLLHWEQIGPTFAPAAAGYVAAWQNPALLLGLSAGLLLVALWHVGWPERALAARA